MAWDKKKIKTILPHREPFLFIDKVTHVEKGKHITAARYFDPKEFFFKGHFPHKPILPGVIAIEAMAQAGIILYSTTKPEIAKNHPDYYFGKVKAEFFKPIFPKDTLILDAYNIKILDYTGIIEVTAKVKSKIVAKSICSFAVKRNEK